MDRTEQGGTRLSDSAVAVGRKIVRMDFETYYPTGTIFDLELSEDDRQRISKLSPQEVARIDHRVMSFANYLGRKVFYVAMSARDKLKDELPNVPPEYYILRVQKLIEDGRLIVSHGEIENWRGCEIVLPLAEIELK